MAIRDKVLLHPMLGSKEDAENRERLLPIHAVNGGASDEVFIGLQGWGYTLEDLTAGTDHVELPCSDTVAHEPQGWVSSLLNEYPSDAETLSAQGIFDEASYLDRETGLERSVRHRAGLFRAHHIVGANCEDPCKLGSRILTSYGRGADQLVEAILAESDTPLHYTEIAERARIREGRSLDARRAHNAAANVGYLFARGTYGLARHVPLSDEQMSQIRNEADDIVCSEAPGRQWHTSEILSEISERMNGGFDSLGKYVLDIALGGSRMLRPLGKMTWVAAGADTDNQSRIDVHRAVVAIVQAAGRPLSTSEIKERLTAVRGVNEYFQISPIDPLIRVQPGRWGINDRDVPIPREERRELVQQLVNILDKKQSGIHASELSGILPLQDSPPDAFLSIASQDKRLKIAQGRYVYLAEWGSPRRETIGHAVSAVLEGAARPLALGKIAKMVASRIGRKIDKPVISGALQALEAEFNDAMGEWSLNTLSTDDDEDTAELSDDASLSADPVSVTVMSAKSRGGARTS